MAIQRIQVHRRRFGFKIGQMVIAIKEYKTGQSPARLLTFGFMVKEEFSREALRTEILRRITPDQSTLKEQASK